VLLGLADDALDGFVSGVAVDGFAGWLLMELAEDGLVVADWLLVSGVLGVV